MKRHIENQFIEREIQYSTLPARDGLYDPANEQDSCGVGFIANIKGKKSHRLVNAGIEILVNLTHRGATGSDPRTGDGAGIFTQIPHAFFVDKANEAGFSLPAEGEYGLGCVFLPQIEKERQICVETMNRIIAEEGQTLLGWRALPVDSSQCGEIAGQTEPVMQQVFIARGANTPADMLEWKLYVIRQRLSNEIGESDLKQRSYCYMPSLSSRSIIYKGMLLSDQVQPYFADLNDEKFISAIVLVHQRYSTNTFPTWDLGQPFRYIAHNGEINTLRGNMNWMHARESMMQSEKYGADLKKIFPIVTPGASDSANFDHVLELLTLTGRTLPQAISMMIPEPWSGHEDMSDEKKAYYEYQACLMEPWDGPASMSFTDGKCIGTVLDRNGLRPSRYWVTDDGDVVMGSEAGVLPIPQEKIVKKGRLEPGRMFLIDTEAGRIIDDAELKKQFTSAQPYRQWIEENQLTIAQLPEASDADHSLDQPLDTLQRAFGYSLEDLKFLMQPMAADGKEALGSMGTDTPLAVLSERPQMLYNYFKQLFAQVTNPPLDAIREKLVTSLITTIGSEGNLLAETPAQSHLLRLEQGVVTNEEFARIQRIDQGNLRSRTFSILFKTIDGAEGMHLRLAQLRKEITAAIQDGISIIILSDRGVNQDGVAIPALLATSAVHHHLVRTGQRTRCGIVVETGEAREIHQFALLAGYGAGAVNPYLAFATLEQMQKENYLSSEMSYQELIGNYIQAINTGMLKVMSKMGISTLQSYRGAQIFEALGLNRRFIREYFTGTPTRIEGIGFQEVADETLTRHAHAYPSVLVADKLSLDVGGQYAYRRKGEAHLFSPDVVSTLQHATRINSKEEFLKFSDLINLQETRLMTLRGLLTFKNKREAIPLEEVEPITEILKRFATGAMSYGSISKEAHETLAIAMNRIGARSNTGEGGEDPNRFSPDKNGDSRRSSIKQVASGRFGVTSHYLCNADEIQIKMAQGAKPGEGGQLPGHKVDEVIAKLRHSTKGVGLISPPPHHDIYSIEDMAQLIHDLKNANREARICVKLVSEIGVGTVASGVAKGKSDVILISGFDGGTGASPLTSTKHAGLPWELGLAEAHQVLLKNNLRSRIILQTDGQIRTAKDVLVATMLGAEEWGIATAALVVSGCIMMRKCHLNTCPVGIATQDRELRKKFKGEADHVVNYFVMLAEEMREQMAKLGFRTIEEMVGRVDLLETRACIQHYKAKGLDFSAILHKPEVPEEWDMHNTESQDHGLATCLDVTMLLKACQPAIEKKESVVLDLEIVNINRTVGTILSSEITKKHGPLALPADTIQLNFTGSAGQSFMAFAVSGVTARLFGDANDYVGKGLSGGKVIVRPAKNCPIVAAENVIAGNVILYGATSGEVYLNGLVGERFCVRNSGALAVVEGIGDHGCEYMTGGRVVILGETGRNFGAGMSGGVAYILDQAGDFSSKVNTEMVDLEDLSELEDQQFVLEMITRHVRYTESVRGQHVLDNWDKLKSQFVKVMPTDYKRALAEEAAMKEAVTVG